MINKKIKRLISCVAAGAMCLTATTGVVNAAATNTIQIDTELTESMIDMLYVFNGTNVDISAVNADTEISKAYFDEDAQFMYGSQSIVSDLVVYAGDLGISLGIDFIEDSRYGIIVEDIYAVVTEVRDKTGGNVIYVPDTVSFKGVTVEDMVDDIDGIISTGLEGRDYFMTDGLLDQTVLDIHKIVLDTDMLNTIDYHKYDYMFVSDNVSQIINPITVDCLSSYVLEGGIHVKSTNPHLESVNRDVILKKDTGKVVYHNYPHSYDNENFKNGVLTFNAANQLDDMALANVDWVNISEMIFDENVENVGNVFKNNNNLPETLTFLNKDCKIGIEELAEYIKTVKGYKGTEAETFANEYGIKFVALDEEVTTTEPVVTTTASTTEKTTTTTTYASHERPTVECVCTTDENSKLCPDCGIPYDCDCGAFSAKHPSTSTTTTTSTTTNNTTISSEVATDDAATSTTVSGDTTGDISDSTVTPIRGDANSDGKLNVRDAAFIATAASKGELATLPAHADHNNDNAVNVRDAASIAGYCAHKHQTDASSTSTAMPEESVTTTTTVSQTGETVNTEVTVTEPIATEPAKIEE